MRTSLKTSLTALCLVLGAAAAHAAELPLKAFAALPATSKVRLSPDGQSIAFVQNLEGNSYLVTQTGEEKLRSILASDNKKFYITDLQWVNNSHLLVSLRYPDHRYGKATTETRMLAVNRDGGDLRSDLLQSGFNTAFYSPKNVPQIQDSILGNVADDPESVLVALDIERPNRPDVYRLNVKTAKLKKVAVNPGGVYRWMADRAGEARIGMGWSGRTVSVIVRPPGAEQWQTLASYSADNAGEAQRKDITPLGFDGDPRYLYVNADHEGRQAVFRIDLGQPGFPRELVHADHRFDVSGWLIYAPWLKKVVGIQYHREDGARVYWNEDYRALQQLLDKALPRQTNTITSSSDDGMRHIVVSASSVDAARIYRLDRQRGQMQLLSESYPGLPAARMSQTEPVVFQSRDGKELHGYLTLPHSAQAAQPATAGKKPPLVLFPHGGPSSRDTTGFDYWTQFFASRGWAVLQVNFRGSSGYGSEFESAGFKRWGLEMQDDLTDGVKWLIGQGRIDPQKICIVGASYGGYAAMMGTVRTPELYRCAVSIAGISDLRALLAHEQHYIGYELGAERQIGQWWGDRERLRETSAITHAKNIRTPLLLIHGREDRVVMAEQSSDMAAALERAGNTAFRHVELPLGDHSLSREEDRVNTFAEMERFLKAHLD